MPLDAQLMDRVFNSPQLPSLPAIALEIIDLVQQDEVNVDKISETISRDPALSSKMLKIVNSSFYGLPKTVGSVHQAVVVLGLNSVKTLALGFSLVGNLTDAGDDSLDHMGFWRNSLYSATASKLLCERLNIVQAEEVFVASLLQNVGVLALSQVLGKDYASLMRSTASDHLALAPLEREVLGGDHMEVGAALAESWGLPPLLVESIRLHEHPDEAPQNLIQLIRTVTAGAFAAELIEDPEDEVRVGQFYNKLVGWFDIDRLTADQLLQDVFKYAAETQRLFELPTGELANAELILKQASEALGRLSSASSDAVDRDQIPAQPPRLESPVETADDLPNADYVQPDDLGDPTPDKMPDVDPLTGLAGRWPFEGRLDELFILADANDPLSLLYIDIDALKQVNDAHGTDAGDGVLRELAEALQTHIGRRGDVYRFEDDTFTVLCPVMARKDAAVLAEEVRALVEGMSIEVTSSTGDAVVNITVSVGVATYDGEFFKRGEQLLKAASRGVLAAKDSGRNVVRVFVPR